MPTCSTGPSQPELQLRPLRLGLASDRTTEVDLMIVVQPPVLGGADVRRPQLHLGLVIDRSGSMEGDKLEHAKKAAIFAVDSLEPDDEVAVVAYDSHARVLVPTTRPSDRKPILHAITSLQSGDCTDLHEGWLRGGSELEGHARHGCVSRLLLLSDGLANQGETDPAAIASNVRGLRRLGISTSTMGVGYDYDGELMETMAVAGGGAFHHIRSSSDLPRFFEEELAAIANLFADHASLRFIPGPGVEVSDLLNDFPRTANGEWELPPLVRGRALKLLLRLRVAATTGTGGTFELGTFGLLWRPAGEGGQRQLSSALRLPVLEGRGVERLPADQETQELLALLEAQRDKRQVMAHVAAGRVGEAGWSTREALRQLQRTPSTAELAREIADLEEMRRDLGQGRLARLLKEIRYQSYSRRHSSPRY